MTFQEFIQWCIDKHRETNHYYDEYLPYEFHLRMVENVYKDFRDLLDTKLEYGTNNAMLAPHFDNEDTIALKSLWGHDLIEDTRVSYNDIKNKSNQHVADIVYAVTNEKGKTREERANDKYYDGIKKYDIAVFVKLCDRIANVQYSKMTKSRMFETYKKENPNFIMKLGYQSGHRFEKMFTYLIDLFETETTKK